MQITKEMSDYVQAQKHWDEDVKQDVLIDILYMEEEEVRNVPAFMFRRYTNKYLNHIKKDARRREILAENEEEIRKLMFNTEDTVADPMDLFENEQEIRERFYALTGILADTLVKVYVEGMKPQEVALEEGEDVNAIYARIHRAKKILRGE